jgi:signal transduction histidine kinase
MNGAEWSAPWGREADRGRAYAVLDALWAAPWPVALLDRELRIVRVNAALARAWRRPGPSLAGAPAEELLSGLVSARELRATIETGAGGAAGPLTAEWPPGAGETTHWLVTREPVRADGGEVLGVCVFLVEVTARRRAEDAAERARAEAEAALQALIRLQAVTASLAAALTPAEVARVVMERGVGLLDAAAGSLSWTTRPDELEVLDAFGYPDHALVAWRRYAVDVPAPLAEAFRTVEPVWIESPAEYAARYPHLSSPGRPLQGASVAVPLVTAERVVGVLGIEFDAPRRFDAPARSFILAMADQAAQALERARLYAQEEELRARAERAAAVLDTTFSSVPIGLAFVDWDLRFVHVNAAWARLHGAGPQAFAGRAVGEALAGPAGKERAARWRKVLGTGEAELDVEARGPGGEEPAPPRVWLECAYPVVAGGDVIGLALVAREVTAARRAEEFRRNLLGIVGHDLRSPLTAIAGSAQLLARSSRLDERQRRTVARIEASAMKATRIAHDLLDLTRIESRGGIPIEPRPARVDELCAAASAEAETSFPGRTVEVAGAGDPTLACDPDRVSQALSNLVGNALKHGSPDAPVRVAWEGHAGEVTVSVHNEGPPVPEAVRAHLFEPFRQGTEAGARASGVGLGLYIAGEIARAHGGSIEVRSGAREGTTFTLRLPRGQRG